MILVLLYVSVKLYRRIGPPEHKEGILISLHTTTGYQSYSHLSQSVKCNLLSFTYMHIKYRFGMFQSTLLTFCTLIS